MKADARSSEPTGAGPRQTMDDTTDINQGVGTQDGTRAADNISQWTSYLPPDCVKAMIAMGWDRTT
jgi:hypothetical protein